MNRVDRIGRAQNMRAKYSIRLITPVQDKRGRRSNAGNAGFTFVELLVVLALLGLLVSMVAPYLVAGDHLSSAARQLVRLLDELQVAATNTHTLWRVRFDLDRRMYWVTVVDAGGERQPAETTQWANPVLLPGKVWIRQISTIRDRHAESGQAMVQVFPDNRPEPFTIQLYDEAQNFMAVTAHPLTGRVDIVTRPPSDERLDAIDDRLRPLLFPVLK